MIVAFGRPLGDHYGAAWTGARRTRAERVKRRNGAPCTWQSCEAVLAPAARRAAAVCRTDQRPSAVALATAAVSLRPALDRTARSAHCRRDPRQRNLRGPICFCRQGRDLRRPLDLRHGSTLGGMGGRAVVVYLAAPSARRRVRHHPRQRPRAGRRMDRAARLVALAWLAA